MAFYLSVSGLLSCHIYGSIWLYVVIYGHIWLYVVIYGHIWLYVVIYGYIWLSSVSEESSHQSEVSDSDGRMVVTRADRHTMFVFIIGRVK